MSFDAAAGGRPAPAADSYLGPLSGTPHAVVEAALSFAQVSAADTLFDIGCNDGRVLVAAARSTGARCVGVEVSAEACARAEAAVEAGTRPLRHSASRAHSPQLA